MAGGFDTLCEPCVGAAHGGEKNASMKALRLRGVSDVNLTELAREAAMFFLRNRSCLLMFLEGCCWLMRVGKRTCCEQCELLVCSSRRLSMCGEVLE